MLRLFQRLPVEGLLSAFPNAGYPKYHDGRYLYFTSPEYFANAARGLAAEGARLIGGCCGIGPQHIAAMVEALKGLAPVRTKVFVEETPPPTAAPTAAATPESPNILELVKKGKMVVMTELDPPKTLDMEKYFAGAKALTEAGSDVITLADNSLAILRVSNLAIGAMLKERFNIEPLLHLSCRDRNLLGLQSELMGMSALDIHHVLPLTGDPAKSGDHPGASSVYDVSSIELIGIIKRMNEGVNYTGKSIKLMSRFIIGCTFNPNAKNMDAQVSRLERKVAAGAQYVMTQPVFETRLVTEMHRRTAHLGVPIFTGVWPLLNGRQAEFLHNEVPGIVIPERVRAEMAGKEGAEGRSQGIELAKEVCRVTMDLFPGVYLITPFLNYDTTVELARFIRGNG
jgi:homocysteine S-methyltransferase